MKRLVLILALLCASAFQMPRLHWQWFNDPCKPASEWLYMDDPLILNQRGDALVRIEVEECKSCTVTSEWHEPCQVYLSVFTEDFGNYAGGEI